MRIAIVHSFALDVPAGAPHLTGQLLLTPRDDKGQSVLDWTVECEGMEGRVGFSDAFGNLALQVNQVRPAEGRMVVTARGTVETRDVAGVLGHAAHEPVPNLYLRTTTLTRVPVTLYGKYRSSKDGRIEILHALMARVADVLRGRTGGEEAEPEAQSQNQSQDAGGQSQSQGQTGAETAPPEALLAETIEPDAALLAHAFVGAARALDIPARFVLGYLFDGGTVPAFHAWAEAHDPALGWIGFDPKLGTCPSGQHVRLAAGLDMAAVTPVRAIPAGDGARTLELNVRRA